MRSAKIDRKTAETDVSLELVLDGKGNSEIDTGCGFLDHMLVLFAKHGRFDLKVKCKGDIEVDFHHTVEDVGICLGTAFKQALGDKKGIVRYGDTALAMDEALILTAVDISGRSHLSYKLDLTRRKIGTFDSELVEEFLLSFVRNCPMALHVVKMSGSNSHHIVEGAFKSMARSLKKAVSIDEEFKDEIPSTKGVL